MGIRLFVEVLDYAPTTLTHREKLVLAVLAEDAPDKTRVTWSSVESPEILRRGKVNRPQMYEVLKALITKGVLKKVTAGQKNARAAEYMILPLAPQCPGSPDTDTHSQCPQNPDTDGSQCQEKPDTDADSQCPEIPDTDPAQCPQNPDTDGSQCQEIPDTYPLLPKRDISPAPPASSEPDAIDVAFHAFWNEYPRKIAKKDALKAFSAAVADGTDPAHLTAMAIKHRAHWAAEGRKPTFIPYPATWLRRGNYDDELHTPQPDRPQPTYQDYADRGIY